MSKVEARVLVLDHRDEERERLRAVLREHHLQGIVSGNGRASLRPPRREYRAQRCVSESRRPNAGECRVFYAEKSALSAGGATNILQVQ